MEIVDTMASDTDHHVVSISWNVEDVPRMCDGENDMSAAMVDLHDAGILPVVAVGNSGAIPLDPGEVCSAAPPSDSFVALAVGGAEWVDGWRRHPESSAGIDPFTFGDHRIVGVLAPFYVSNLYYYDLLGAPWQSGYATLGVVTYGEATGAYDTFGDPPLDEIEGEVCNGLDDDEDDAIDEGWGRLADDCAADWEGGGTSYSAPAVAGALTVFREYYLQKYSQLVQDPGILMTQALIHGSGAGAIDPAGSSAASHGMDHESGAGMLQMRVNDSTDLAAPWGWGTGHMCVYQGDRRKFTIRGSLPTGVKEVRVVAWHEDQPGRRDYFDLSLLMNGILVTRDDSDDENQRVVLHNPLPGNQYELEIHGRDIRWEAENGCGKNGERVYWAFMYAGEFGF